MYGIDVVSLAPDALIPVLSSGVMGRAWSRGLVRVRLWDLREFTRDAHRKVDDVPFGGGSGMVLMAEPVVLAVEHALDARPEDQAAPRVVILAASGRLFTQALARSLADHRGGIVVVCGRYEGIDARAGQILGAEEISIGDYVLSSGEPAAVAVIDAVVRLLPGALGDPRSAEEESFGAEGEPTAGLLEYPQFTRPRRLRGLEVPEVLCSGDHGAVAAWRREQSLRRTLERRPELLAGAVLTSCERQRIERWKEELSGQSCPW